MGAAGCPGLPLPPEPRLYFDEDEAACPVCADRRVQQEEEEARILDYTETAPWRGAFPGFPVSMDRVQPDPMHMVNLGLGAHPRGPSKTCKGCKRRPRLHFGEPLDFSTELGCIRREFRE